MQLYSFYAFLIGLCFGSFANVLAYRLPRKESIVKPPSYCPACKRSISIIDLIPLVSWLVLRGRCRYCGVHISVRYPAVELFCALLFAGIAWRFPFPYVIPLALFVFVLLSVSLIDWDTQEIPDGLLAFGVLLAVVWIVLGFAWYEALLGALVGAMPLLILNFAVMLIFKKNGFGFGDVKLMAVAGLFLGWYYILMAYFFAFVLGGVYAGFLLVSGRGRRGDYIAFAPFLAFGVFFGLCHL